jgi:AcrR family transcriptional regulator
MAATKGTAVRERIATQKHAFVREEILNVAANLIASQGFRAVTMDTIASTMGYTKSVIYYYFKNKNEILWEIFSKRYESFLHNVTTIIEEGGDPGAVLGKILRAHAICVMTNPSFTAVYNREVSELNNTQRRKLDRMHRDYDTLFEDVFKVGVKSGTFRNLNPHVTVAGMLGMCNSLYVWYNEDGPLSAEEIAETYVTILCSGCLSKPGED